MSLVRFLVWSVRQAPPPRRSGTCRESVRFSSHFFGMVRAGRQYEALLSGGRNMRGDIESSPATAGAAAMMVRRGNKHKNHQRNVRSR
jgi:hypothetical protein